MRLALVRKKGFIIFRRVSLVDASVYRTCLNGLFCVFTGFVLVEFCLLKALFSGLFGSALTFQVLSAV